MNFTNLLSGFIGASLGVLVSLGLFYFSCWRNARDNLRAKLLELYPVKMMNDPIDYRAEYDRTFREVWRLYLTYRDALPPLCRGAIDRAWRNYKGHKAGSFQEDYSMQSVLWPASGEDVMERAAFMLRVLGVKA